MKCECVFCPECNGTGNVWFNYHGKYLGKRRFDDMDELETCPNCNGKGIIQYCNHFINDYEKTEEEI
jgi:ssDNA-binding Zn-finger/Zn-ribbon topoisomerase 1